MIKHLRLNSLSKALQSSAHIFCGHATISNFYSRVITANPVHKVKEGAVT